MAVAALALAACSGSEASTEAEDAPSGEGGAYPVTIEHAYGSTTIPAEPQRVVSLGYTEQDSLVLFGVEPVAVRYAFGPEDDVFFPWADEAAGDADPEILPREDVNFEQIAALEPDLIMAVTAGLTDQEYETLSQLAPTVVQPAGFPAFGTPWQEQTLIAGRAFGQEDRARQIVDDLEERFDEVVAQHPELEGRTITLSGPAYEGEYPFHATDDARTRFFGALGLRVPAEQDEIAGDEFYGSVSQERADVLDADVIVWQSGSPSERAGIEADPVLSAIPAVAEGRSIFIEGSDYDALQFSSALSLPYLLDGFVPQLAALPAPD